jgi:hypothetical protein
LAPIKVIEIRFLLSASKAAEYASTSSNGTQSQSVPFNPPRLKVANVFWQNFLGRPLEQQA